VHELHELEEAEMDFPPVGGATVLRIKRRLVGMAARIGRVRPVADVTLRPDVRQPTSFMRARPSNRPTAKFTPCQAGQPRVRRLSTLPPRG